MRDVQHILVFTAVQFTGAQKPASWTTNEAGFSYSDDFGFGLLQASQMVHAAKVSVPLWGWSWRPGDRTDSQSIA